MPDLRAAPCRKCKSTNISLKKRGGKLGRVCLTCRKRRDAKNYKRNRAANKARTRALTRRMLKAVIPPGAVISSKMLHLRRAEIIKRVSEGEHFLITLYDGPVLAMIPYEEYRKWCTRQ
jgi:hypothetical protein